MTFKLSKWRLVTRLLMLVAKSAIRPTSRSRHPLVRPETSVKAGSLSRPACERKANSDFATSITVGSSPYGVLRQFQHKPKGVPARSQLGIQPATDLRDGILQPGHALV